MGKLARSCRKLFLVVFENLVQDFIILLQEKHILFTFNVLNFLNKSMNSILSFYKYNMLEVMRICMFSYIQFHLKNDCDWIGLDWIGTQKTRDLRSHRMTGLDWSQMR